MTQNMMNTKMMTVMMIQTPKAKKKKKRLQQ